MPIANISINGVDGSNDDLPINTLVQLNNQGIGGETAYAWTLVDQPEGTADALSSGTIVNPTFTPKKEGTYVVKLVVNQGTGTESIDYVVAAVRQLKTRERIPGATETTQMSASRGWAIAANRMFQRIDATAADSGVFVGSAGTAGLVRGNVLRATSSVVIKSTLPGQETVMGLILATAAAAGDVDETLFILEAGVNGSTTPANAALIRARGVGFYGPITGAGSVLGQTVFLSDTGVISLTTGTNRRAVGTVIRAGAGDYDILYDGGLQEGLYPGSIAVADAAGLGIASVVKKVITAAAAGTPDDVTIYSANAPFAFTVLDCWMIVTTAIAASTVTLRTAAGGGGSVRSSALDSATTGKKRDAITTAVNTIAAGGTLVARRSDRGVAGELYILISRP